MDNRTFGYARVSSREQNENRQIEALISFGVLSENIIIDKCSGKDTEREGYQYLKKKKNTKFGRPSIEKPGNWDIIVSQVNEKEITVAQAIQQLNISRSSFYRLQHKTTQNITIR